MMGYLARPKDYIDPQMKMTKSEYVDWYNRNYKCDPPTYIIEKYYYIKEDEPNVVCPLDDLEDWLI